MVSKTINLGFVFPDGEKWTGETNYLISLISSLNLVKKKINFYVICSRKKKKYISQFISSKNIVQSYYFQEKNFFSYVRKIIKFVFNQDLILKYFIKKYKINVISHSEPQKKIRSICWIPDFQHVYLSSFFSKSEIKRRNILFNEYLNKSDHLIVSSLNSFNHLKKFYKKNINLLKISVLRFVPKINFTDIKKKKLTMKKYKLNKDYVYIPNQFWKHKNHNILIDTAQILKKKKYKLQFVLTGNIFDKNENSTFNEFQKKISIYKVQDYFNILGFLDYREVVNLIYHAKILLNPSLFEGWSTTVEEGKIFNKDMILSNLKVHKEQCKDDAVYFNPSDANDLSNKLIKLIKVKKKLKSINDLKKNYKKFRILFAKKYLDIVESTFR